jgi:ADP-heptose:LPS heptosyltransferase
MSEVVFTMPGKAGDALHQWPVAYHWAKQNEQKITLWLDEKSCKIVAPLFEAQPCVEKVEFKPGIESYNVGGQPFHFDLDTKEHEGKLIYHLGMRSFPQRQLTLHCLAESGVPVKVDPDTLTDEVSLATTVQFKRNRVILHGQAVCPHTRTTPNFWKFLYQIQGDLETRFDEIVFVGDARDLEVAARTYPKWKTFDDKGNFKVLADYMDASQLVIGVGSSVVVLASLLKIPSIRVHDPISDAPKVIWENLQRAHLNDFEVELRKSWPSWRDQYFPLKVLTP